MAVHGAPSSCSSLISFSATRLSVSLLLPLNTVAYVPWRAGRRGNRDALRERRLSGWSKDGLLSCSFSRQTPVGDCTSSEDVPDAWSLSPSDPIFRFSWTISGVEKDGSVG
ncbi:hypothetical protein EYF80_007759 [Liparis tanakae]|uniref:Uncharacterized protein n=1 Tax=Liparis tanakae TaxID=230148 RepID=A0A4Z2IXY7_9TELE|nr:hypothetical protein EYF80_007759 [Liparis tanakae]